MSSSTVQSSSSASAIKAFAFLRLPPEIRLKIYCYLTPRRVNIDLMPRLQYSTIYVRYFNKWPHSHLLLDPSSCKLFYEMARVLKQTCLSLRCTCHQIYEEVTAMMDRVTLLRLLLCSPPKGGVRCIQTLVSSWNDRTVARKGHDELLFDTVRRTIRDETADSGLQIICRGVGCLGPY